MSTADAEEQEEEASTLAAIFGEDSIEYDAASSSYRVYVPSREADDAAVLRVLLPASYPSVAGPVVELEAPQQLAGQQQLAAAVRHMESMFCPGQVCLFDCIQWLRDTLAQWRTDEAAAAALAAELEQQATLQQQHDDDGGSTSGDSWHEDDLDPALRDVPESAELQRQRTEQQAQTDSDLLVMQQMQTRIISGEPLTERKSTFQAHVAPVSDVQQVRAVVGVLLESNKIRNATHNIMAYRIAVADKPGVFVQDCDDDGEAAAGGRLLHLLQVADVQGAVVVVSRWFGGILLGPARFGLINNTARQLLEQTGYISAKQQQGKKGGGGGRKK